MLPFLIGAGVSAGAGLLGGYLNRESNEAANAQNMMLNMRAQDLAAQQHAATLQANQSINAQNMALQREFAQSGIQWRAADARAAGINPLAALGGGGASFSPVAHVSGGSVPGFAPMQGDTSMGNALANSGSDISRAIYTTANDAERARLAGGASTVLGLENQQLQNELLKSQIARLRQNTSPPMPVDQRYMVDGQGNTGLIEVKKMEQTPPDPRNLHSEPGSVVDVSHARTASGDYAVIPSKDFKDRGEDQFIPEVMWAIRNNLMPAISNKWNKPPPLDPGQGHNWSFNPFTASYERKPTRFQERFTGFERR